MTDGLFINFIESPFSVFKIKGTVRIAQYLKATIEFDQRSGHDMAVDYGRVACFRKSLPAGYASICV